MDQTITIVDRIPVAFDLAVIGRKLGIRPEQTKFWDRLDKLAQEAVPLARPKAAARLCDLAVLPDDGMRVGEIAFASSLLRRNLGELGRAFPYLATEGVELAEWALSRSSSVDLVFANGLRESAVKQAEAVLEKMLMERYGIEQLSAMNPGSLEIWPISQQTPLFQLLDPIPETIEVTLLPSLMMQPEHTVSGIFFQTDTKYYNCQLCPREDCPNRKAPSSIV